MKLAAQIVHTRSPRTDMKVSFACSASYSVTNSVATVQSIVDKRNDSGEINKTFKFTHTHGFYSEWLVDDPYE